MAHGSGRLCRFEGQHSACGVGPRVKPEDDGEWGTSIGKRRDRLEQLLIPYATG